MPVEYIYKQIKIKTINALHLKVSFFFFLRFDLNDKFKFDSKSIEFVLC